MRGQGIGVFSYLKACDYFIKNLSLQKIIFQTPKINIPALRIKEKIGIPWLGDVIFDASVLIKPLDSNLYEVDRASLNILLNRHGIS